MRIGLDPATEKPREILGLAHLRGTDGGTPMIATFYPDPAGWRWAMQSASGYLHAPDWTVSELEVGDAFDVWSFEHEARLTVELVRVNRRSLTTRIIGTTETYRVER